MLSRYQGWRTSTLRLGQGARADHDVVALVERRSRARSSSSMGVERSASHHEPPVAARLQHAAAHGIPLAAVAFVARAPSPPARRPRARADRVVASSRRRPRRSRTARPGVEVAPDRAERGRQAPRLVVGGDDHRQERARSACASAPGRLEQVLESEADARRGRGRARPSGPLRRSSRASAAFVRAIRARSAARASRRPRVDLLAGSRRAWRPCAARPWLARTWCARPARRSSPGGRGRAEQVVAGAPRAPPPRAARGRRDDDALRELVAPRACPRVTSTGRPTPRARTSARRHLAVATESAGRGRRRRRRGGARSPRAPGGRSRTSPSPRPASRAQASRRQAADRRRRRPRGAARGSLVAEARHRAHRDVEPLGGGGQARGGDERTRPSGRPSARRASAREGSGLERASER